MRNIFFCIASAMLSLTALDSHAYGNNLIVRNAAGHDQYCLDASLEHRETNGTPVTMYKCHGHSNQRWSVTHDTNGQSAIVGLNGFCLDVKGAHSKASGTPVELWQCHFGSNQLFNVQPNGQIKEVESGKCLMAMSEKDKAPVVLDTCSNNPTEIWHFSD